MLAADSESKYSGYIRKSWKNYVHYDSTQNANAIFFDQLLRGEALPAVELIAILIRVFEVPFTQLPE